MVQFGQRHFLQRQTPKGPYPLSTFEAAGNVGTAISRLHLGATFYLLQFQDGDEPPSYAIESEGHPEGFSLDEYITQRAAAVGVKGVPYGSDFLPTYADE